MTRRTLALALLTSSAALAPALAVTPAHAAVVTVTKTALQFKVTTGPEQTLCNIDADLYVPSSATPQNPAPAILTTNGFSGSKADQAGIGTEFGAKGYVVLSYTGLGFNGSSCDITTDDRQHDGVAARQLVDFLAGQGQAYTSYSRGATTAMQSWTGPVPAPHVVKLDGAGDPRVGMIGGSYGGQIQFAAAAVDPRIDTLVPLITWNDLVYSLTPGNGAPNDRRLPPGLPGVSKTEWSDFFTSLGFSSATRPTAPNPPSTCPGFSPQTCPAAAQSNTSGFVSGANEAYFRNASVSSYINKIKVPVLLGQGEADTLFDLQEATANYRQLQARGVPVKMMWQSWGHSRIGAAPGEYPSSTAGSTRYDQTYQGQVITAWFDHYLKGNGAAPALDFSYFRPWVYNSATGSDLAKATAAYGKAPAYPAGIVQTLKLSGTDALTAGRPAAGTAGVVTPPTGAESYSETSAVGITGSYGNDTPMPPPTDPPGTAATYTGPVLTAPLDVVGVPHATIRLTAPAQSTDPASQLVVFGKLLDVAPDGSTALIEHLISPVRVKDVTVPVQIQLPGIVHRFDTGHRVRFVVASSDSAYAGNTPGTGFSVLSAGSSVQLPVIASDTTPPVVPEVPLPVLLPVIAGTGFAFWRRWAVGR